MMTFWILRESQESRPVLVPTDLKWRTGITDHYPKRTPPHRLLPPKNPTSLISTPKSPPHQWLLLPKDPASLTTTPKGPRITDFYPQKSLASLTSTPKGPRITDFYPQRTPYHWLLPPKDRASLTSIPKGPRITEYNLQRAAGITGHRATSHLLRILTLARAYIHKQHKQCNLLKCCSTKKKKKQIASLMIRQFNCYASMR